MIDLYCVSCKNLWPNSTTNLRRKICNYGTLLILINPKEERHSFRRAVDFITKLGNLAAPYRRRSDGSQKLWCLEWLFMHQCCYCLGAREGRNRMFPFCLYLPLSFSVAALNRPTLFSASSVMLKLEDICNSNLLAGKTMIAMMLVLPTHSHQTP